MNLFQISILSHILVVGISAGIFVASFLISIKSKRKYGRISPYWKFFNWGVFIILLSEIIDIFTPIFEAPLGGPNVFSESIEIVGLGFLFLALLGFTKSQAESNKKTE